MQEPIWVSRQVVLALHDEQLAEHGGSSGIRDEHLLDSALAKPHNVFAYEDAPSIFRLAASYAFGLARNRAFVDGNKRIALVISVLFLNLNGWGVQAEREDVYATFLQLAEGSLSEDELTAWFEGHALAI
jgi:death-on-curing protein